MRKTGNLLIRDATKKTARESLPVLNSTTSISGKNEQKQNSQVQGKSREEKRNSQLKSYNQIQKEITKAQNLNEQQQLQIHNEAKRTVAKRVKASQSHIENDMIILLEQQCSKLGGELEKQRATNDKLRSQIELLRKNIEGLNVKLEKMHEDRSCLSKNQQDGRLEVKQLMQELTMVKQNAKIREQELKDERYQRENIMKNMENSIKNLNNRVETLNEDNLRLREENEEIEEELKEKTMEAQVLRQTFQTKKLQWQASQRQFEAQTKLNLQKKGQKLTKFQTDYLKLQEKLKQEETIRKKVVDKNKQLEKEINYIGESKKQLQETITGLRKRVNDLSILKSTNNTIMNQKIAQLMEENEKLKTQISQMQGVRKPISENQKPVLFGSNDFQ